MQVLQAWKTLRWPRLTLLTGPAAGLVKMKVHVYSDSILRVGVSNPGPSNIGQQNWRMYGTNTDVSKHLFLQPEKCNSFGTYYQVFPFLTARYIFSGIWTGNIQNLSKIGSYSCHCSTTLIGHTCLHNAKEVAAFATQFKPGQWCFLKDTGIPSHYRWLTYFSVTLHLKYFQHGPLSIGQLRTRRNTLPLPRYIREQEDSHQYHVGKHFTMFPQSNLPVIWYRKIGAYTERIGRRSKSISTRSNWP